MNFNSVNYTKLQQDAVKAFMAESDKKKTEKWRIGTLLYEDKKYIGFIVGTSYFMTIPEDRCIIDWRAVCTMTNAQPVDFAKLLPKDLYCYEPLVFTYEKKSHFLPDTNKYKTLLIYRKDRAGAEDIYIDESLLKYILAADDEIKYIGKTSKDPIIAFDRFDCMLGMFLPVRLH